jgi:hypothetical protein
MGIATILFGGAGGCSPGPPASESTGAWSFMKLVGRTDIVRYQFRSWRKKKV